MNLLAQILPTRRPRGTFSSPPATSFRQRRLGSCFGFCFWLVAATALRADEPQRLDTAWLDSLRLELRTNHPSVAAAEARLKAAEANVRAIPRREDPMVGAGVMFADRNMREDQGDMILMAEQPLPRRRLYEARQIQARAERTMAQSEARMVQLELETMVGMTAIELALADEMIAIETEQLAWLEKLTVNARERLKDPMGNASESLRMEAERARQQQRLEAAQLERRQLAHQLNNLLGRATDAPWSTMRLPAAAELPSGMNEELNRLFTANPSVRVLLDTVEMAKAEVEVMRREQTPMFTLGMESSAYSGGDVNQATLLAKMTLPFFNRSAYRANVERARQRQVAAGKEAEALVRKLRGQAIAAQAAAENAARQAATVAREVVPRAQVALQSTQNAWVGNRASLLEVIEAQRALLEVRFEERRYVAAHRTALETLRSIVPPASTSVAAH